MSEWWLFHCKCFQLGQGQSQVTIWTSLNNIQTCYIYNRNVSWNWNIECLYFPLIFVPNCFNIWKIERKRISAIETNNSAKTQNDLNKDNDYCHAAHTEEGGIKEICNARNWDSIVASCAAEPKNKNEQNTILTFF